MTSAGGLAFDRYSTAGSSEWLMRVGRVEGPPVLFLPPLLEEMNRTRAFLAGLMRRLAAVLRRQLGRAARASAAARTATIR